MAPTPFLLWPAAASPQVYRAGCSTQDERGFKRVYQNSQLTVHLFAHPARVRINGDEFIIQAGDLTLTPPNGEERFDFSGNGFHWYLRIIPPTNAAGSHLRLPLHLQLGRHSIEARRRIECIVHDWRTANQDAEHPAAWAAAAGSQAFVCWLASITSGSNNDSKADDSVSKATTILNTQECANLSIAEIARRAGMSQNRLAAAFRERHGITMHAYRIRYLIEIAKWMIQSTDLPLATVRARIGIHDAQRFNKLFKRATGLGPRAWQELQAPAGASIPLPAVPKKSVPVAKSTPVVSKRKKKT